MAIQNVTHGSVTFPFDIGGSPTYTTGTYVDGIPYIVVPSGSITLNEPTPVQSVTGGGRTINGSMKNPYHEANPFDSQISANFNDTLDPVYPLSLTAGDWVVKVESWDPTPGATRDGVIKQWACIHVVASAPGANDFSPPPFWTTSFGARPTLTCDVDALAATMPSLSTSGMTMPTWSQVAYFYDRFNPGYAMTIIDDSTGYEAALQWRSGANGGSENYGEYLARNTNTALVLLLSDAATTSEKRAIIKRTIQHGAHHFFAKYSAGNTSVGGGGAHHQFMLGPVALALKWTGNSDKIKLMRNYAAGNFAQAFYIDQAYLDARTPHSSASLPQYSRLKAVETAWDGTYIWTNRNSEDTNLVYKGLKLVRQSDGAYQIITGTAASGAQWRFKVDADLSPPSAIGDQLYCAFPDVWTPTIGTPEWGADPGFSSIDSNNCPSYSTGYRTQNYWSGQVMAIKYFGIAHPWMQAAIDYCELANTPDTPHSTFDMPEHFDTFYTSTGTAYSTFMSAFWNAHWATCKSQPRSVTFADSFTVTNS